MALTLGCIRLKKGVRCYLISGITFCIFFIIYLDNGSISAFLNKKVPVQRQVVKWEDHKHRFDSSKPRMMISYKGRMGNHMFEYATLLGISKKYNMTPIIPNDVDILDVFQIPTPQGNMDELLRDPVTYKEDKAATYAPIVEKLNPNRDAYLVGYFQSWKYFNHIRDELLDKHFILHKSIQKASKEYINNVLASRKMEGAVLVGIHVRRGDFVRQRVKGYTAAPIPYYYRAMSYFRKKYKRVMFIICTNDLIWAETNLDQGQDVHYSHETDGALDFGIMINCDHMIITSGSYSWWAGYLVRGEVIYYAGYPMPNTIIGNLTVKEDYYPPNWLARW